MARAEPAALPPWIWSAEALPKPPFMLNKKILCRDLSDFINSQSAIYITPGGVLLTLLQKHLSTESRQEQVAAHTTVPHASSSPGPLRF